MYVEMAVAEQFMLSSHKSFYKRRCQSVSETMDLFVVERRRVEKLKTERLKSMAKVLESA